MAFAPQTNSSWQVMWEWLLGTCRWWFACSRLQIKLSGLGWFMPERFLKCACCVLCALTGRLVGRDSDQPWDASLPLDASSNSGRPSYDMPFLFQGLTR